MDLLFAVYVGIVVAVAIVLLVGTYMGFLRPPLPWPGSLYGTSFLSIRPRNWDDLAYDHIHVETGRTSTGREAEVRWLRVRIPCSGEVDDIPAVRYRLHDQACKAFGTEWAPFVEVIHVEFTYDWLLKQNFFEGAYRVYVDLETGVPLRPATNSLVIRCN